MSKIAVIYHSGFGHTEAVAKEVVKGLSSVEGAEVEAILATEVDNYWDTLNQADTIVFGSPTYMGSVSAPFKEFMDKTGRFWMEQHWKDKLAAGFTCSSTPSGDKLNVLIQMAVFAAQHSMLWISNGFVSHTKTENGLTQNRLGVWMGVAAQANVTTSSEDEPNAEDRYMAEQFGRRIAELTARWTK